jgi:hypothetical protein
MPGIIGAGSVSRSDRRLDDLMNNRSLFIRASVAAAIGFVLCCLRARLAWHVEFSSKRFGVFAGMLFGVCVAAPFVVAFLGRRSQYQWHWTWVLAATAVTMAVLGITLYGVLRLLY